MIQILIVDDSALLRSILKNLFQNESDLLLAGEATHGQGALFAAKEISPDLIIMDIDMPVMDGLEATRRIMQEAPTPVLVMANGLTPEGIRAAIGAGAADAMAKPSIDQFNEPLFLAEFLARVRTLARKRRSVPASSGAGNQRAPASGQTSGTDERSSYKLVVMGSSTGGPAAVKTILTRLPADFPLGIILVQHMESGFMEGFVRWLDETTPLSVRIARHREVIQPGSVHISPTDIHLKIRWNRLSLENGPRVLNQKPSVDLLFESAAAEYRERVIGVLLTGMGRDGAQGCLSIVGKGGITIVQDQPTSAIYGMPRAAVELDAATKVLPLEEIAPELMRRVKYRV